MTLQFIGHSPSIPIEQIRVLVGLNMFVHLPKILHVLGIVEPKTDLILELQVGRITNILAPQELYESSVFVVLDEHVSAKRGLLYFVQGYLHWFWYKSSGTSVHVILFAVQIDHHGTVNRHILIYLKSNKLIYQLLR